MAQEADERRGGEIKKEIQKESREPGEIRRRRRHLGVSLEVRMCLFLVVTTAVKESVVCFSVGKNHALCLLRYGRTVGVERVLAKSPWPWKTGGALRQNKGWVGMRG